MYCMAIRRFGSNFYESLLGIETYLGGGGYGGEGSSNFYESLLGIETLLRSFKA